MAYSPQHHHNHRKRKVDRSYDRDHHGSKRDNHKSMRSGDRDNYDNRHHVSSSRRFTPSPLRNVSRKRRQPHSPSPPLRSHSIKRHSRSRSPRYGRAQSPYYPVSRTSRARSPSTPIKSSSARKVDYNNKISDTSLFAELVKDKHKRNKVLQELMDKRDENIASGSENSNSGALFENNVNVINTSDISVADLVPDAVGDQSGGSISSPLVILQANGIKDGVCLVDIPMPNVANILNTDEHDGVPNTNTTPTTTLQSASSALPLPPLPPPLPSIGDEAPQTQNTSSSSTLATIPVVLTVNLMESITDIPLNNTNQVPTIKQTYTITKPRNLTTLPMPPGVNVAELEDITTPSPPRSISPINTRRSPPPKSSQHLYQSQHQLQSLTKEQLNIASSSTVKKGLLNLPMPPMVPGSEDLSGDDEIIGTPPRPLSRNSNSGKSTKKDPTVQTTSTKQRKRPTILNRRNSRSQMIKDWGERCVDVFEVIAQIGEGTYGQVSVDILV